MSSGIDGVISVRSEIKYLSRPDFGFGNTIFVMHSSNDAVPLWREFSNIEELSEVFDETDEAWIAGSKFFAQGKIMPKFIVAHSGQVPLDALESAYNNGATFSIVTVSAKYSTYYLSDMYNWCEAMGKIYVSPDQYFDTSDNPAKTGVIPYHYRFGETEHTVVGVYAVNYDYQDLVVAGMIASMNFDGGTIKTTLFGTRFSNIEVERFTDDEIGSLDSVNANRFINRSGIPIFEKGLFIHGDMFVDTKYWLMWFESAVRTEIFTTLYNAGRIPQTNAGLVEIINSISRVCNTGIRNGGIGAGYVSPAMARNIRQVTGGDFDGLMQKGYLIYAEPFEDQSQHDRERRVAPNVYVWIRGSDAIQNAEMSIVFSE